LSLTAGSMVWATAEMASRQVTAEMRSNLDIHFSGAVKITGHEGKGNSFPVLACLKCGSA
jgi:hypothetical protein